MDLRKDALVAAAEMILAVEHRGHGAQRPGWSRRSVRSRCPGCRQRRPGRGHLHPRYPRARWTRPAQGDRGPGSRVRDPGGAPPCPGQGRKVLRRAGRDLRSRPRGVAGSGRPAGWHPPHAAQRRRPRRAGHRRPVPDRHAVRALQRRHQPQPRRIEHDREPTSRPASCSTSCAIFPEPAMSDPRPLWLRDPLAVLAVGDAAGGIVVAGNRITELVPAGPGSRPIGRGCASVRRLDACRPAGPDQHPPPFPPDAHPRSARPRWTRPCSPG